MFSRLKSIKSKVIITIVIIMVATILPVAYFSVSEASKTIERNTISAAQMELEMLAENLEEIFAVIENTAMTIILRNELREILTQTGLEHTLERRNALAESQSYLQEMVRSNPLIADINVVQQHYVLGANARYSTERDQTELAWYERAYEAQAGVWKEVEPGFRDTASDVISYTRNIIDLNAPRQSLGIVNIELDYNMILERLSRLQSDRNYIYVMNHDGDYVIRPEDLQATDKVEAEGYVEEEAEGHVEEDALMLLDDMLISRLLAEQNETNNITDESHFYERLHGENALVIYHPVSGTEWALVSVFPERKLLQDVASMNNRAALNVIIGIILASIVGYVVTSRLTQSIGKLQHSMKVAEAGDLSIRAEVISEDEIGSLAESFNNMLDQLSSIVSNVQDVTAAIHRTNEQMLDNSDHVMQSSTEITRAIDEVAKGASHQAMDTNEGVELSTILSEGINQVTAEIEQVQHATALAEQNGVRGQGTVHSLTDKSIKSTESLVQVIEAIHQLDEETEQITSIVDLIVDISGQTNLLALNAAIEAARVGEAGKGFAVVAEEIKSLSDQVKTASDNIANIITQTRERMSSVAVQTDVVHTLNKEQGEVIVETEAAFVKIIEGVQGISGRLSILNEHTATMDQQRGEIVMKMQNISAVSEQSAASCEEVASSMASQEDIVVQLGESIKHSNEQLEELSRRIAVFKL